MTPTVSYTSTALDRAHLIRRDPAALARAWGDARRRVVPVWRNQHPVGGDFAPLFLSDAAPEGALFLGLVEGAPWFAVDISDHEAPPDLGGAWLDLRAAGPALSAADANILGTARGLLAWHRGHRFCGACGTPTGTEDGGHVRACGNPDCGRKHFPRLDPAVIMLITDDQGRALLGHAERMPPGMLTTLAGFVEHGETLEQAVAREVAEETSVVVDPASVTYLASQPWPFPGSLMLAFTGRALRTDIAVDPHELAFAGWYTRAEVATFREVAEAGDGPALPRRDSVSRTLINHWLAGRS
ncbi:NAD(+) diphosphatase [Novispirillum sp. DQ9]|uniref:NAD(+) diphosphatase n=1 Tax=Novispirillum sp. DQ9 TaxID=3398612 RepID=UPI003C7B1766